MLLLASVKLGVQPYSLTVSKGIVSVEGDPTRRVSYGELLGEKKFEVKISGSAPLKPSNRYRLVGPWVPRVDIPDKMAGKNVPGEHLRGVSMLHGRVALPCGQAAFCAAAS